VRTHAIWSVPVLYRLGLKTPASQGALKKKNERPRTSAGPFFIPTWFFFGISRRFSASGVQKHQKTFLEKKSMSKMFYKKMRKIPCRFFGGGLILIEATYRNGIHGSH
jgi:hypothetical protein